MVQWRIITMVLIFGLLTGCDSSEESAGYGNLVINFSHRVDGSAAAYDMMIYENAAGNNYEISEIQWFISDVTLIDKEDGAVVLDNDWIHYIDTQIEPSLRWAVAEDIKAGEYKAIRFTFGIKGEKNIPGLFSDLPESNMIWPYPMGGDEGGYHYMKLNGFWMKDEIERTPFNFHIGVGQIYAQENNITGFVQNWFETTLPLSGFTIDSEASKELRLVMNVENWFVTPHVYDHDVYGGKIMNNQEAMGKISENGADVFSVEYQGE